jgi:hypothetical protein
MVSLGRDLGSNAESMDAEARPGRGLFRTPSIAVREYLLVLTSRREMPVGGSILCYQCCMVLVLRHSRVLCIFKCQSFTAFRPDDAFLWYQNARQSRNRFSSRNVGAAASSFGLSGIRYSSGQ